jgi:SAM-dependent methyltransferase
MTHGFDTAYWEQHWQQGPSSGAGSMGANPANPYLARETGALAPGTALDAGCGSGAEAIWLAVHGWRVTAADISSEALSRAAERATAAGAAELVEWIEADLSVWHPAVQFDLVTTHYAHPAIPQLEFYDRIASWVAPGGTLLVVGHLAAPTASGDGHGRHHRDDREHGHSQGRLPPVEVSATAAAITERLDAKAWEVVTAQECHRMLVGHDGREVPLHDVVVRAIRPQEPHPTSVEPRR